VQETQFLKPDINEKHGLRFFYANGFVMVGGIIFNSRRGIAFQKKKLDGN